MKIALAILAACVLSISSCAQAQNVPSAPSLSSPAIAATGTRPTDEDGTCSGLKIDIRVPDDIVAPQSTVLLEIKLTNIAHSETWLPSGSLGDWSYEFELRDAQGNLVPQTAEWKRALSQRAQITTMNVAIPLAAGASLTRTITLEKLFDLNKPGQYALRVSSISFACSNTGTRIVSNLIHFTVGATSSQSSSSKAAISVHTSLTQPHVPVGWGIPLDIVVLNRSDRMLRLAVEDPPNMAPDEFLSGVEVFDSGGVLRPPPNQPYPNWSSSRFRDTVSTLDIPPGKSAEKMILLGDLFDIGKPGRYRAKVALVDPISNQRVESDTVSFEIKAAVSSVPLPKQPPFLVTLQSGHFSPPDPSNILICVSNVSDHEIRMDNGSTKDFLSVENLKGNPATLTQAAQEARKVVDLTQEPAGLVQCCTWSTVKPREALCGGLTVGAIYNLSKAGAYRIRVDRYDEPDAIPGQKLADLPVVHSNWLTIFENPTVSR